MSEELIRTNTLLVTRGGDSTLERVFITQLTSTECEQVGAVLVSAVCSDDDNENNTKKDFTIEIVPRISPSGNFDDCAEALSDTLKSKGICKHTPAYSFFAGGSAQGTKHADFLEKNRLYHGSVSFQYIEVQSPEDVNTLWKTLSELAEKGFVDAASVQNLQESLNSYIRDQQNPARAILEGGAQKPGERGIAGSSTMTIG